MAVNIGPKIGVDGEAEYRKQINNIIQQAKTLNAEMKAVSAGFDKNASAQEKAAATAQVLTKQIDTQRERVKLLGEMLQKATNELGENDTKTLRWKQAVNEANAELSRMERELEETQDALDGFEKSSEDAGEAASIFGDVLSANVVSDLIMDGLRELGQAAKEFAEESIEAAAEVKASNAQFEQTFGDLEDTATRALENIADETGVAASRMKSSYTTIFSFAKTVGAETEDALDIASRAMEAAADSAAYYDKTVEEATETLQSFLKGNYENDAALGISATETTRNAKANEMYATSFDKLAESQKVDVLLAMVEAGNAASGALGQAAREADSWANVTGEAEEAWKQLQAVVGSPIMEAAIPVIQGITDAIYELIEQSDSQRLAKNFEDLEDSLADAEKQLEDTSKDMEANAVLAERYAKRLGELEKAGLNSAEAQREYANIAQILNELYPGLNLQIDENTGLMNKNAEAILDDVEALKQKAMYEAMGERQTAILKAQAEAMLIVADAERALIPLEDEELALKKQLAEVNAKLAAGQTELTGQSYLLSEALLHNRTEQEQLNQTIDEANATIAENDALLEDIQDNVKTYASSLGDVAEAQNDVGLSAEGVQTAIADLTKEYEDAKQTARSAIDSQIGYFDKLTVKSSSSAEKIIKNWSSQEQGLLNYSANLQKAVDMGLDETLVQQLSDGSVESMAILDEFVNDTYINVDEINEAFGKMVEAREIVSETMADIRSDANEELDQLVAEAEESGTQIPAGVAAGVNANSPVFVNAMNALARKGIAAFNRTMDINSPSRVMEDSGEDSVRGAVVGVEDLTSLFERTMEDLARAGQSAFSSVTLGDDYIYPHMGQSSVGAGSTNNNYSYGGIEIYIYQQPGEDGEELAYKVMERIQFEISKKEASVGG